MDIQSIVTALQSCPCGRPHTLAPMAVEIGPGLLGRAAEFLAANGFPRKVLVVADKNTLRASAGILEVLVAGGFACELKLYDDLRVADMEDVNTLEGLCNDEVEGVLSVGTGSLNDICRLASYRAGKAFAIFATAPSMDGFASGSAPILEQGFKRSIQCRAPSVIIGDTDILAAAPAQLKAAGFGDMLAKYVALVDWHVARLTIGEYFCPRIAALVEDALGRMVSLAGRVTRRDPETAGAIMEALVMTGLGMALSGCTRAGSGSEHMIAHFWEIKTLERGEIPGFHGTEVGVATLLTVKEYRSLTACVNPDFHEDRTDWGAVYAAFGPRFERDVRALNTPTVTDETSPAILRARWPEIREIVRATLPPYEDLLALMQSAGAATSIEEIGIDPALAEAGEKYHPYMRHRMTLSRLRGMMG